MTKNLDKLTKEFGDTEEQEEQSVADQIKQKLQTEILASTDPTKRRLLIDELHALLSALQF